MIILEPCKDCPDRHPICHDSCPKYAEYKRQQKAQRIYTSAHQAAERISRNDFDKEGWMGKGHSKERSKTYPGIAKAMAEQWG